MAKQRGAELCLVELAACHGYGGRILGELAMETFCGRDFSNVPPLSKHCGSGRRTTERTQQISGELVEEDPDKSIV